MPRSVRATHAGPDKLPADSLFPKSGCFIGAKGSHKLSVRHLFLQDELKGSNSTASGLETLEGQEEY